MTTGDRGDEQRRWEDRKEDQRTERDRQDRDSRIARGLSHNADALRAFYGHPLPYRASSGTLASLRELAEDSRRRLLRDLEDWSGALSARRDACRQTISELMQTEDGAEATLDDLLTEVRTTRQKAEMATMFRPSGPPSLKVAPLGPAGGALELDESCLRRLQTFERHLERFRQDVALYRKELGLSG